MNQTEILEKALVEREFLVGYLFKSSTFNPSKCLIKEAEDFLANERQIEQIKQSAGRVLGIQESIGQKNFCENNPETP